MALIVVGIWGLSDSTDSFDQCNSAGDDFTRCFATPVGDSVGSRARKPNQASVYAGLNTEEQIAFFNSKNYQLAGQAGYEILKSEPVNAIAPYY